MGHFGRRPIRLAWFGLVLPALVLNYLGQGALLLEEPRATHPFFQLAAAWALYPLVGISTAAAIIASQALISGSFSITRQAVQLGLAPRLDVEDVVERHQDRRVILLERMEGERGVDHRIAIGRRLERRDPVLLTHPLHFDPAVDLPGLGFEAAELDREGKEWLAAEDARQRALARLEVASREARR